MRISEVRVLGQCPAEACDRVVRSIDVFRASRVGVGLGKIGLNSRPGGGSDRRPPATPFPKELAQVIVRLGKVRSQLQARRQQASASSLRPCSGEGNTKIVVCPWRSPVQVPGRGGSRDRFVQVSLLLQGKAHVGAGGRIIHSQFQGAAIAGDRLVQLALVLQHVAQVVGSLGVTWIESLARR